MTRAFRRRLTPRERELMEYLAKGLSCKQCATAMGLSQGYIKVWMNNLRERFDAESTLQLMAIVVKEGMVRL